MKIALMILAVIIGLLSIAAGGAKIALVPEEVEFLQQFGFTSLLTISFGVIQVLGGIMLMVPVTRLYGAITAALGFALSLVLILVTGNLVFAAVSAIPVVLASLLIYKNISTQDETEPSGDQ